jgi:hypothetical protein
MEGTADLYFSGVKRIFYGDKVLHLGYELSEFSYLPIDFETWSYELTIYFGIRFGELHF